MKRDSLSREEIYRGTLILVNSLYGCQEPEASDLLPVPDEHSAVWLERRAAIALEELMAKISGWDGIVPVSGWRSLKEQQSIWDTTLLESGLPFTQKFVALPGHSEHQTGLAIDLGLKQEVIDFICPEFPYEGICQSFRRYAPRFGFVERYPKGKEAVTGIGHEPWHFRYVGLPHSLIMERNGLTLEEYIDAVRDYPCGQRPLFFRDHGLEAFVSYLKASTSGDTALELEEGRPVSISGNNVDGYIITEWRRTDGIETNLWRT